MTTMIDRNFPAIVDVGANLAHKRFKDDLPAVLARAHAPGSDLGAIVITGTSMVSSRAALTIARDYASPSLVLRSTAGVHPHDASSFGSETAREMVRLLACEEVAAVGECGLDYDRMFSPREAQLRAFEEQLDIAIEAKMPVFLHERMAHDDFVRVLRPRAPKLRAAMVHCFTGTADELATYLELGLHIGMTGYLCDPRRGTHLPELVRRVPRGRLHVETDAPFLLPRDYTAGSAGNLRPPPRDGRNEPSLLRHVLRAVARARAETEEDTALHTREASRAFFSLPELPRARPTSTPTPTPTPTPSG